MTPASDRGDVPAPSPHPAGLDDARLLAECDQRFLRRSGPGGQNRNKVETAVVLHHRPTDLSAEANERRTQGENRREAVRRLRFLLAREVRKPVDPLHPPSPLWQSRLRGGRIQVNPDHDDVPALLAEALDHVHDRAYDLKAAADVLGCTPTQLVRLLRLDPKALAMVNHERGERGLRPML